jgi:hypothetical protein
MTPVSQKRCFHHAGREAAALCLACGRFFCRECVTEHGDRMLCTTCLKRAVQREQGRGGRLRALALAAQVAGGVLLAWLVFYAVGRGLLRIPDAFHEDSLWREKPLELP